eukprot:5564048-Prorocentrum_lima.AAC.1
MLEAVQIVEENNQVVRASDWVAALMGTKAGVYLLYGHPNCDWNVTLQNPLNSQKLTTSSAARFKGTGIYPINACDWWLSAAD